MKLLVSVSSASEASAAVRGGADLIDAKNPRRGALGAVSIEELAAIHAAVAGERPVTAALGDATGAGGLEAMAEAFAAAGPAFVKIGFGGLAGAGGGEALVRTLIQAARRAVGRSSPGTGVVAVAYADHQRVEAPAPPLVIAAAAAAGAAGLLIDTADKTGPGLRALVDGKTLGGWVAETHGHGLFAALAGKLSAGDLEFVRAAGADIAGVRGAACDGGRQGVVRAAHVRKLRERCAAPLPASSAFV